LPDLALLIQNTKETSMTTKGDTHEHENKKVFSYQKNKKEKKKIKIS